MKIEDELMRNVDKCKETILNINLIKKVNSSADAILTEM